MHSGDRRGDVLLVRERVVAGIEDEPVAFGRPAQFERVDAASDGSVTQTLVELTRTAFLTRVVPEWLLPELLTPSSHSDRSEVITASVSCRSACYA